MADVTITREELNDPKIDEVINLEKSLAQTGGQFIEDVKTPFYLNPVVYYATACVLGAFSAWCVFEPFYNEGPGPGIPFVSDYLLFGLAAALMGLAMGVIYGAANHNGRDCFYCGAVGVGVGLLATIVTTLLADLCFGVLSHIALAISGRKGYVRFADLRGGAFFLAMCGRALAWAIVSAGAGLGLGVALKSKKLILNGLAGGLVGGTLGGLLFDPIGRWLLSAQSSAAASRAVGMTAIGLLVGLFVGLFENISKDSWFLMLKGPLAGKQFSIFKSPMTIGSAPKRNIYLFKDAEIDPLHASVIKSGNRYMLQDEGSKSGTFVNGRRVDKYVLRPGDVVTIGQTVLKYHEKQKS
ncbi:MAG: FHA domain-containing protein [Candidatus Brocadiia bacterium]|jgi:hypothetical protein